MAQYTSFSGVKLLILVLAFGFFAYMLGPPLYWHFVGDGSGVAGSCPPCNECPEDVQTKAALADLHNMTLPACPKGDADMEDELQKTRYQKLQEEMKVQKQVAEEEKGKSDAALLEAKKTASQFQKEFEKCNSGMETSEGAREKAEELLVAEKKKAALWEARAKELGWKDEEGTEATAKDEDRRETEEAKTNPEENSIPRSKNGQQVMEELQQNLVVARFLYERAVGNEMNGVKAARQRANLL
ncbi:unnamed protein product [Calypogeia fissa]